MRHFANGVGGGFGVGAGIVLGNYLFGSGGQQKYALHEESVWSGEFGATMLMVMAQIAPNGMTVWLKLYGIEGGAYMFLGGRSSMLHMMALVQQWESYLTAGRTVEDWRANQLAPQQEQRSLPAASDEPR